MHPASAAARPRSAHSFAATGPIRHAPTRDARSQMARDVVEGVERLDGALKRREPAEVVQPMIQRLQQGVKDVSVAVERIGDVR